MKINGILSAKQVETFGQKPDAKNFCESFLKKHFKNRLVCKAKKNRLDLKDVCRPFVE